MKILALIALLAACGDRPTQEESQELFAATMTAMNSARTRALADQVAASVGFEGPCTLGGTVAVAGDVDASSTRVAFDLRATFDDCGEPAGTLDGDLRMEGTVEGSHVEQSFHGSIALDAISCDIDAELSVGPGVQYDATVCGYELHVDVR